MVEFLFVSLLMAVPLLALLNVLTVLTQSHRPAEVVVRPIRP
jgi:hypothetical protein